MKILIAARDDKLRLALTFLFTQEAGVRIIGSVSDAAGLLALAQSAKPDIILLDRSLPGVPVEETVDNLRSFNKLIKILLVSAGFNPANHAQSPRVDAVVDHSDPPEVLLSAFRALRESDGVGGRLGIEPVAKKHNNELRKLTNG